MKIKNITFQVEKKDYSECRRILNENDINAVCVIKYDGGVSDVEYTITMQPESFIKFFSIHKDRIK